MGSKTRIKHDIIPIINNMIWVNGVINYYEPFCGGCNVIDRVLCKNKYANDINKPLIEFWKRAVLGDIKYPREISRELFNDVKNNQNTGKYELWFVGLVGALASYNGRGFVGGYAVKQTDRDYYSESVANIKQQVQKLKSIQFLSGDYSELDIAEHSLIYCDIPYKSTTGYGVEFNYGKFWEWVREQSKRSIVLVSEEQAPEGFECIWEKDVKRTLNPTIKPVVTEKLFVTGVGY